MEASRGAPESTLNAALARWLLATGRVNPPYIARQNQRGLVRRDIPPKKAAGSGQPSGLALRAALLVSEARR